MFQYTKRRENNKNEKGRKKGKDRMKKGGKTVSGKRRAGTVGGCNRSLRWGNFNFHTGGRGKFRIWATSATPEGGGIP